MKLNFLFILTLLMASFQMQAQADEPQVPSAPVDPFEELQDMFQGFNFMDLGDGFQMDTMMLRQFGGSDFESGDFDQALQDMMQMMMQFDLEDMPQLNQLFEELDLHQLQPGDMQIFPDSLNNGQPYQKPAQKKKRKTYQL